MARAKKTSLTAKEVKFVDEYLIDLNAKEAAVRAGYSPKTAAQMGYKLVHSGLVAEAIRAKQQQISHQTGVTTEFVITGLRTVAERCMQAAPVLDRKGDQVYVETPSGGMAPAFTFQAMGANRSLELLGKHLGLFDGDKGDDAADALAQVLAAVDGKTRGLRD